MLTNAEKADALGRTAMFAGLDHDVLSALAQQAVERRYPKNATVVVQDEAGDRMFVVVAGAVRVVRTSGSGERLELLRRREGETFGELALLDGGPRLATVETVAPTVALALSREVVMDLLQRQPTLVAPVLEVVARMVRETVGREADLAFLDLRGQLARRLLALSSADSPYALSRGNRVTQVELAQMVGGSRQRVNAALQALARAGCIAVHETGITVLSRGGLGGEIRD